MSVRSGSGGGGARRRFRVVVVVACGVAGLILGWMAAWTIRRPEGGMAFGWIWPLALAAATVAGVIGGLFVGIVLGRSGRGGFDCPRCGTENRWRAAACSACGLPFAMNEGGGDGGG